MDPVHPADERWFAIHPGLDLSDDPGRARLVCRCPFRDLPAAQAVALPVEHAFFIHFFLGVWPPRTIPVLV